MNRKERVIHFSDRSEGQSRQRKNEDVFRELLSFVLPDGELFSKTEFHGNIKWVPEQLAAQALIWSWQDSKCVTAAFVKTLEACERIHLENGAKTYTGFMDAMDRYYTPRDRSLAKTLHALRKCIRNLDNVVSPKNDIIQELAEAVVQRYTD